MPVTPLPQCDADRSILRTENQRLRDDLESLNRRIKACEKLLEDERSALGKCDAVANTHKDSANECAEGRKKDAVAYGEAEAKCVAVMKELEDLKKPALFKFLKLVGAHLNLNLIR